MYAALVIKSMGASISLVDGKVRLAGLDRLDLATAVRVLEVARAHKTEIMAELRGDTERTLVRVREEQPREPSRRRKWMTPDLVENFKAARPWLLEHLEALLVAGWTRDELFRVHKPLGHTLGWGVAWLSGWRNADHVELQPNGWIAYHFKQVNGSTNILHSWPRRTAMEMR
nr:hypothetical protein [Fundidesulfovibrio terrae]